MFFNRLQALTFLLYMIFCIFFLFGCSPQSPALQSQGNFNTFLMSSIQFLCLILIVYYLIVLNPSKVRADEQAKFISELKKNDEVLTSSGFFGRVVSISADYITLDLGSGVKVKVQPSHIRPIQKKEIESAKVEGKLKNKSNEK